MPVDREVFSKAWLNPDLRIGDVEEELGISERTIRRLQRKYGLPDVDRSHHQRYSSRKNMFWTEERKREFIEAYPFTDTRILAKKYDISHGTVRDLAYEFGVKKDRKVKEVDWGIEDLPTYEELMQLAIDEQIVMDKLVKTPEVVRVEIDTDLPIALTTWADLHLGHPGVDIIRVGEQANLVCETDGLFMYFGADGSENFLELGGRYAGAGLNQQQVVRQRALLVRLLQKLESKVIAVGSSTEHTGWSKALTGIDDFADIIKRLNLIYTDVGGLLELQVGKQTYYIFRTHRFKYHSDMNLTHTAKQCWRMGKYDADIVVVEHRHAAAVEKFLGHGLERIAIRTGTAKVSDDYARKHGYYGQRFANPTVILFPNERRMIEFLHMEDAIIMLKALRGE